jgi:hypothetical protein
MLVNCTARRVPRGQKMVKRVYIVNNVNSRIDTVTRKSLASEYGDNIDQYDMYSYVKQKPNRKLFGLNPKNLFRWHKVVTDSIDSLHVKTKMERVEKRTYKTGAGYPLYLALHNFVKPERLAAKQMKADQKFIERNKKRSSKNRPQRKKRRKLFGEILLNIGESPVLLDTMLMHRSTQQLEKYLDNKGYFRSEVRDSIAYPSLFKKHLLKKSPDSVNIWGKPKKKVIVYYIAKPAHVYTLNRIKWQVEDDGIKEDVFADSSGSLLASGMNYDVDVFEAERERIVSLLRNRGYFLFTRDFVVFSADTTIGNHQVNITINVKANQQKVNDSTYVPAAHKKYYVRNVYVKTIYDTRQLKNDEVKYDTLMQDGVAFLRNTEREEELRFRPKVFTERIFIRTDSLYRQYQFDETYDQITSLHVFRQVVVDPKTVSGNKLDVHILLFAIPKQNFTVQAEGINTGGYLGIGGSFSYQNNNLDRGAELLEFRVKGGTEAQQPLAQTSQTNAGDQITFNTMEFGAELSLKIPRAYFPFSLLPINVAQERKTVLSTSYSYQRRVDFDRAILNFSFGYTYKRGKWTRIGIYPIELNVVGVNPREGLQNLLANGDVLLRYRFTDHLINDLRVSYVHNQQGNNEKTKKRKWKPYLKFDAEMSGVGTYQLMNMIGAAQDTFGSYQIAGIPFSHYYRLYVDGRLYKDLSDHQMIVTRLAIGTGFPQKNFRTLPLEKSFYGGGANGIRAWEARSLGPGSLNVGADEQFAQFGEVQIEYNVELRFKISKSLFGALFADGGNMWLLPSAADAEDDAKFNINSFYKDFAFGPGFGIRYDLSFFIVRFDFGFKLRDPAKPLGDRWWSLGDGPVPGNLNFGIGYPF